MKKATVVTMVLCLMPLLCNADPLDGLRYLPLIFAIVGFLLVVAFMNVVGWMMALIAENLKVLLRTLWVNTLLDIPVLFYIGYLAIYNYQDMRYEIANYRPPDGLWDKYGTSITKWIVLVALVLGALVANILLIRSIRKKIKATR